MKPNTAKRKGAATEQSWVGYLTQMGWPHAERRHLAGTADRGDIAGCPGVTVEVKSGARLALAQWMAELEAEMANDRTEVGYVAIRPPKRPQPQQWWCVVPAPVLLRLLKDAGW